MKQNSMESLLEKYREGTLSEAERAELERLTHKDEVTAAACRQATGIVRRRIALAVSVLMVGGAGVWAVLPQSQGETLVAETQTPVSVRESVPEKKVDSILLPQTSTVTSDEGHQVADAGKEGQRVARRVTSITKPIAKPKADPVVVCNNQCDADSVINDIKKFLSV